MAGSGWFVGGRCFWDTSAAVPRRRMHMERLVVARGRAGIWHCTAYYPRMHEIPWICTRGTRCCLPLSHVAARRHSCMFQRPVTRALFPLERERDDHPRLLVIVSEATRVQMRKIFLRDTCKVLDSWTCSF